MVTFFYCFKTSSHYHSYKSGKALYHWKSGLDTFCTISNFSSENFILQIGRFDCTIVHHTCTTFTCIYPTQISLGALLILQYVRECKNGVNLSFWDGKSFLEIVELINQGRCNWWANGLCIGLLIKVFKFEPWLWYNFVFYQSLSCHPGKGYFYGHQTKC